MSAVEGVVERLSDPTVVERRHASVKRDAGGSQRGVRVQLTAEPKRQLRSQRLGGVGVDRRQVRGSAFDRSHGRIRAVAVAEDDHVRVAVRPRSRRPLLEARVPNKPDLFDLAVVADESGEHVRPGRRKREPRLEGRVGRL